VEPYLQRHPDTDITSRFLTRLPYPTNFPRLYTSILIFLEAVELNLQRLPYINITPTPTTDSNSPSRLTYTTIFPTFLHPFYLFVEAAEPNLQSHTYTNIRFGFHSSLYLSNDLYPPLYLHFNFFL